MSPQTQGRFHMPASLGQTDGLNLLLDELDIQMTRHPAGNVRHTPGRAWTCQRRHPRYPFRVNCTIYVLNEGADRVNAVEGRTRNLSSNGLSVLLARSLRNQEPVELVLHVPEQTSQYMAGLVTFCRYAGRGFHEVGVSLQGASNKPIFSSDPVKAARQFEWFSEAVALHRRPHPDAVI